MKDNHMTFNVTRVYCDVNGDSRFEDVSMDLQNNGEIGFLSEKVNAGEVAFRKVAPSYDFSFHNAPKRQYVILLDGEIEIETSLGEKRTFRGGEVLLMEDTWGKGHRTRNLQNIERKSIFITLI